MKITADWRDQQQANSQARVLLYLMRNESVIGECDIFGPYLRDGKYTQSVIEHDEDVLKLWQEGDCYQIRAIVGSGHDCQLIINDLQIEIYKKLPKNSDQISHSEEIPQQFNSQVKLQYEN